MTLRRILLVLATVVAALLLLWVTTVLWVWPLAECDNPAPLALAFCGQIGIIAGAWWLLARRR